MDNIEPGKLFVGGLSWDTTSEKMKAHFEQWGEVTDSVIMTDPLSKRPRGFGFVTFKDPDSAVTAVNSADPHILDNKKIDPKFATMSPTNKPNTKVFVGGLPGNASKEDVKMFFSQYGSVLEVDLKYDKATQRMRGFGFVGFQKAEDAEKVISEHFVTFKGKKIEIKEAEPRRANQPYLQKSVYQQVQSPYGTNWTAGYPGSFPAGYAYAHQQAGGQQQYGGRMSGTGAGYGYGGAYGQATAASFQQYPQSYGFPANQQQQMGSYGQDSTSYPATASSYTSSDGYTNTGYGYSDTSAYQHYADQASGIPPTTAYPRTTGTQQRGAGASGYNSFGGAR